MSDTTRIFVPDSGFGSNGLEAALLANGGFGNGMSNPFWAIVLLAFLRNGFFNGDGWGGNNAQLSAIQDQLSTNHGQTLIMDAIKGNAGAVHELATTIGCNHNAVTAAINGVQGAICQLGNQVGMSGAQVINAIQSGNMTLANQLSSCCCDLKNTMTVQNYENRINNIQQSQLISNGFSSIGYENANNTSKIIAKLDQIEDGRKDREISALQNQLSQEHQNLYINQVVSQAVGPLQAAVADIQCKLPKTENVYAPSGVLIPACQAFQMGLYGGGGYFGLNQTGVFG